MEQNCSELPESLSADAWDFSGDPVLDLLPKPDPDELELLEPDVHSLRHFLTQSWSLKKRNLILRLESDDLEMGSGGKNVMDYVVLVNQPHNGLVGGDMCMVWGNGRHVWPEKETCTWTVGIITTFILYCLDTDGTHTGHSQ